MKINSNSQGKGKICSVVKLTFAVYRKMILNLSNARRLVN